jgi:hypothetical protein
VDLSGWLCLRGAAGLVVLAFAGILLLPLCLFAGIRVAVSAIQASPLCGAAPTFLCRRKEK